MESKEYIKRQEKNDANNVAMISLICSGMPAGILIATNHAKVILLIIILLVVLLRKNYVDMYVKYDLKYKSGNSYLKRKFGTIGFLITIYDYATIYIAYLVSIYNIDLALILFVIMGAVLFITYGTLVNRIWYNFDLKRYKEIDLQNPKQKRYTTQ